MTDELTIDLIVPYGDVDRDDQLLLPGIFKFLQEAAIKHANQFDAGMFDERIKHAGRVGPAADAGNDHVGQPADVVGDVDGMAPLAGGELQPLTALAGVRDPGDPPMRLDHIGRIAAGLPPGGVGTFKALEEACGPARRLAQAVGGF